MPRKKSASKTLVLGSGGREHSICWHLKNSEVEVECAPGSDAISKICPVFDFKNFEELLSQIRERGIEEVIVGPEKYLAEGVADFLKDKSVSVFGPTQAAARLETDKAFSKNFLNENHIPTARSITVTSPDDIEVALKNFEPPFVIKASGLAAGKGVWIGTQPSEALRFAKSSLKTHSSIVIEEFLSGEELSYFVLIDGEQHSFLGVAQDHKRLLENDAGPNTGGMGAYSPVPLLNSALQEKIENKIIEPTLRGLRTKGLYYRGFLFVGVMVVKNEPYVLEFNCRLGDPETQALMIRLKTPLTEVISDLKSTRPKPVQFHPGVGLCVVVAAKGYPEEPKQGFSLSGIESPAPGAEVFHSGTKFYEQNWIASGGRLFSIACLKPSLLACQNLIFPWLENLNFQKDVSFRKDIGVKAYRHLLRDEVFSHQATV
jgi:phosphoribosylamine--glycine ligase